MHDEILGLLRRQDEVGLDELLRRKQFEFETAVEAVTVDHLQHHEAEQHVRDAWNRFDAATQRRLASLIPVALHQPQLVEDIMEAHAGWATGTTLVGGGMTWQQALGHAVLDAVHDPWAAY